MATRRRRLTPGLPQPNAIDDLHWSLELGVRAEAAAKRGQKLLAKGNTAGARKALEQAEACIAEREALLQRWIQIRRSQARAQISAATKQRRKV